MPSVKEVISKIEEAGLTVRSNPSPRSHTLYDVIDPKSGVILTGISSSAGETGGDPNWHWNLRRLLRRAGYLIEYATERKGRRQTTVVQETSTIDMAALRAAQEKAASRGEHIPTLDDLENSTEFFARLKEVGNALTFPTEVEAKAKLLERGIDVEESFQAWMQQLKPERTDKMPQKTDFAGTRERLQKFLEEHGDELTQAVQARQRKAGEKVTAASPIVEFSRVGFELVAPTRGLSNWKTASSAQQAVYMFLKGSNVRLWAVNLIEATLDYFDTWSTEQVAAGLDVRPEPVVEHEPAVEPSVPPPVESLATAVERVVETLETPMPVAAVLVDDEQAALRIRYADVLLEMLQSFATQGDPGDGTVDAILNRLDKLTGLA